MIAAVGIPVLFADWFTTTIWVVVIAIGIINQLLGGDKKKQPPKRPPQPQPGGNNPQGAKGLLDEVERFLQEARKATEQAQKRPPQQQRPAEPQRPLAAAAPMQPQRRPSPQERDQQKRAAAQRRQQQQREAAARKAQRQTAERKPGSLSERHLQSKLERSSEEETFRGSVSEHVQQHLDTRRFAERAGKLSHLQQTVEKDIAGHVHSVFDHQVGTLTGGDALPTLEPAETSAEQIADLLRSPAGIRNAVILQEILRPPVERW